MFHSPLEEASLKGVIRGFVIKLKFTKDFENATEML